LRGQVEDELRPVGLNRLAQLFQVADVAAHIGNSLRQPRSDEVARPGRRIGQAVANDVRA
jgi:hypothetical protein